MADTGLFQLNDIVLHIPPESIRVDRKSFNHQWQTLRTRSSIKVKSGFSVVDIFVTAKFTDDHVVEAGKRTPVNGLKQLRDLISQFRVTPFCFVENEFIRNSVLGGESTINMALAMKNIEIIKDNSSTNVVTVNMYFSWFNYFPYTKSFTFKEDIFSPVEVKNPADSRAWKLMYKAEQLRNEYLQIERLDPSFATILSFNQFTQITLRKYNDLQKEVEALTKLRDELINLEVETDTNNAEITRRIREKLVDELKSGDWASSVVSDVFGHTTTMYTSNDPVADALDLIDKNISEGTTTKYNVVTDRDKWQPIILGDAKAVIFKNELTKTKPENEEDDERFDRDDVLLLGRQRSLNLNNTGLIVTTLSISFENILATMPMIGHPYPSYQHIGSTDARVTLSIMTTSDQSVRELSGFYTMIEDQAHKYRIVPAGHRNITVANPLINMCGLQDMIPDALVISTVEGQPGTYAAELVLIDNPLTPETGEQLTPSQSFNNLNSVRKQIVKVLEKNIKLVSDAFVRGSGFLNAAGGTLTVRELEDGDLFEDNLETGYYQYSGQGGARKEAFKQLCTEYGKNLGNLLEKVFPQLATLKEQPLNAAPLGFRPEDFFQLTSDDVLGIEKLQEDIRPVIDKLQTKADTDPLLGKIAGLDSPIIRRAQEVSVATDAYFETYNRLQEAKQNQVLSDDGREQTINEVFSELDYMKNDQRISMLMNQFMMDWIAFTIEFTDRIRLEGLLDLPEFDEIRDTLRDIPITSSTLSYQDFPLTEVVSLMANSTDPGLQTAYKKLSDMFNKSGLSGKNINLAGLINPDFYFFNPQNDLINEIVPRNIIETARDSIKVARQSQEQVEADWFKNVYEGNIITPEKAAKVYAQMRVSDESIKTDKTPGVLEQVTNYMNRLKYGERTAMAPHDLIGSVGPSIETTRTTSPEKPVILNALKNSGDTDNVYSNYRNSTALRGPKNSGEVKHRFDTNDCLDYLPESAYIAPVPTMLDPNILPVVDWPTYANVRRVTSNYGNRTPPVAGASTFHRGVDIAGTVPGTCDGAPVLAAADGVISHISYSQTEKTPGSRLGNEGISINIEHTGGLVTKYFHLKWDELTSYLSDVFHRKGKGAVLSESSRNTALNVTRGQRIASIGNTGHGSASHLHFETWVNGTSENPSRLLDGDFAPAKTLLAGIDPNNESLLKKSVDQLEKEIRTGQGYGMNRAYPTFKLYFIESDMGERKRFQFDDFFSYSSVKELQVIRSRKIAADLCVFQLTNISGVLSNRKFQNAIDPTSAKDARGLPADELAGSPQRVGSELENPIASLMLQPGIQVQLRLGYSNNPEELETLFNGVITDVEFTESDDLVQVTCQSYAVELVQTVQGEVKNFGGFLGGILSGDSRTEVILNELLAAPEVVHFGRWEGNSYGLNSQRSILKTKWKAVAAPQEDNLFPPQGQALSWFRAILGTSKYVMYNTTIWDVFQEMTMRHPSYIASAVPYEEKGGNARMTMFFGLPDQLYFARDATYEEDNVLRNLKKIVEENQQLDDASEIAKQKVLDASSTPGAGVLLEGLELTQDNRIVVQRQEWFKALAKQYAMDKGFIKPFRSYHVLTSTMHILKNSIGSSGHNTFNTVTVQYSDSSPQVGEDTGELNFGNLKTFTLKADAAIRDEEIREVIVQYPNCVGDEQAKRYAMAVLFQSLKEGYKGELITIGNPKIKPFDVCYVFDEYTDMYGPVEVEQVIHRISQETGFVTEITPDLMVHVNQWATLSTSDAMGLIAEHSLKAIGMDSLASITGAANIPVAQAASGLNSALGTISSAFFSSSENSLGVSGGSTATNLLGVFIFRKLITRTQLAHPFRFSPLVLGGKPMVGGLPNRRTDGSFLQAPGKWIKEFADGAPLLLEDVRDRMNPNYWKAGINQGDALDSFFK